MNRRAVTVAVAVISVAIACAACTHTVGGTAQRATTSKDVDGRGYGYAEDRCGLLLDATVAETIDAEEAVRPYSGAVCQYVLSRHGAVLDATFSWFESGTLDRERALAQQNRAEVRAVVVQRHEAFLARRTVTGNACSATAATNPGVISWWVQVRGSSPGSVAADPCKDAEKLLSKTLSSAM